MPSPSTGSPLSLAAVNPQEVSDGHFGLEGIRKRARLFAGSVAIKSALGKGTRIVVHLPLTGDTVRVPVKELYP